MSQPGVGAQNTRNKQVMRVGSDCTLIHGESLKHFLGGDTAVSAPGNNNNGGGSGGSGGIGGGSGSKEESGGGGGTAVGGGGGGAGGAAGYAWWLECFAVLAPDGLQLFRAPSPAARLDWVTAFAVFATAHELGLCKAPPLPSTPPVQPSSSLSSSSSPHADAGTLSGVDGTTTAAVAAGSSAPSRLGRWGSGRTRRREDDGLHGSDGEDQAGTWGETAAIGERVAAAGVRLPADGGRTTPRTVMQGFLRKRAAPKLWGASEGWEYRWVVLRVSLGSSQGNIFSWERDCDWGVVGGAELDYSARWSRDVCLRDSPRPCQCACIQGGRRSGYVCRHAAQVLDARAPFHSLLAKDVHRSRGRLKLICRRRTHTKPDAIIVDIFFGSWTQIYDRVR